MFLNVGPSHPATHGVIQIQTELDGEIVRKADLQIVPLKSTVKHPPILNVFPTAIGSTTSLPSSLISASRRLWKP